MIPGDLEPYWRNPFDTREEADAYIHSKTGYKTTDPMLWCEQYQCRLYKACEGCQCDNASRQGYDMQYQIQDKNGRYAVVNKSGKHIIDGLYSNKSDAIAAAESILYSKTLYTIGYESSNIGAFMSKLIDNGITHLIDIRAVAFSNKPDFSKESLRGSLDLVGIEYTHLPELGMPKQGRYLAQIGKHEEAWDLYKTEVVGNKSNLENLLEILVFEKAACLMCMERDHRMCHRQITAQETGLKIKNLRP